MVNIYCFKCHHVHQSEKSDECPVCKSKEVKELGTAVRVVTSNGQYQAHV
jgi:RNA polymerase subunit RPABC4/transcription elongation factor Spt4